MSKVLYVEARKKRANSNIDLSIINEIPGKTISLAATVQYLDLVPEVKSYLESLGKTVLVKKGAFHEGHVLGCNSSAFDTTSETLLLITDGKFHAMNNAIQLQREIYVFNGTVLEKVEKVDIEEHNKKTQIKKKKFLSARKVGLLVSSKFGQHNSAYISIKKKIEDLDKKVYIFQSNNLDSSEFENFPQIQIWVNTACFGLAMDHKDIVNLQDILEFLN